MTAAAYTGDDERNDADETVAADGDDAREDDVSGERLDMSDDDWI